MDKYLSREKLLGVKNHKHFPIAMILIIVILLDLVFVNYKLFTTPSAAKIVQSSKITAQEVSENDSCGKNCQEEINKAVEAVIPKSASQQSASSNNSSVQEYFIPLGSGAINSQSMQTIQGMQAYIDGSAYGSIQTVTFEISVSVPTGNETATFQLYNTTANHPVWNSTVTFTGGGTPQLLISSPINLDPGNNLYVVQGQTQLPYPANITQARVHIITN